MCMSGVLSQLLSELLSLAQVVAGHLQLGRQSGDEYGFHRVHSLASISSSTIFSMSEAPFVHS